jgi:hypothetical protein
MMASVNDASRKVERRESVGVNIIGKRKRIYRTEGMDVIVKENQQ